MRRFAFLALLLLLGNADFLHADIADPHQGYTGCALTSAKDSAFPVVDKVTTGSPSAIAGVQKGDRLLAINGKTAEHMTPQNARRLLLGNIGDSVTLTLESGANPRHDVSFLRASLPDTYSAAAAQGDPFAQYALGHYYQSGPKPERNIPLAIAWYTKSTAQGNAAAMGNLADLYLRGREIPRDDQAGYTWALKGAQTGDAFCERLLADCIHFGHGTAQNDKDAFAWYYASARQGNLSAERNLAIFYANGKGVLRDERQAFNWYYPPAMDGDPYAAWGLSALYESGRAVPRDLNEALKWGRKAQAGLPNEPRLQKEVALLGLQAFVKTRDVQSLDIGELTTAFHSQIVYGFLAVVALYVIGGALLLFSSFRTGDAPPKILVALGWIAFYIESQLVAFLAIFVFDSTLTAPALVGSVVVFGALPVIVSSLGSNRKRLWRDWPELPTVLLFAVGSTLAIILFSSAYDHLYAWIATHPLPPQDTRDLVGKAKDSSVWIAYLNLAIAIPLAEEIIFRGYLFEALRPRLPGRYVILITAALFAAIHFQPTYFIPLFFMGLVFGWAKWKTQSLVTPVLLHALNNSLFFLVVQ